MPWGGGYVPDPNEPWWVPLFLVGGLVVGCALVVAIFRLMANGGWR